MRILLTVACLLASATASRAAESLPRFKKHTPYPTVRTQLIRMGYAPIAVKTRPGAPFPHCESNRALCGKYPEIINCSESGALFCNLLFERRSDGRLFMVTTGGDPGGYGSPPNFNDVLFLAFSVVQPGDLDDVVIASGSRKGPSRPR